MIKDNLTFKQWIKKILSARSLYYLDRIYRKVIKVAPVFSKIFNFYIPKYHEEKSDLKNNINEDQDSISVILSGYKRPHTLTEQIAAVKNQTHKPKEILFWQNKSDNFVNFDKKAVSQMKASISNYNFGVWARFAYALNCKSEYVCILDDDTIPGSRWLENCISSYKKKPGLYGTIGLIFKSASAYYGAQRLGWDGINNQEITQVDIVGHAWFFKREALSLYWRDLPDFEDVYVGEDMHFSHMLQKYSDMKTYVPPHPADSRDMWGSVKGETYGGDAVATAGFAVPIMDKYYKKIISRGFKIINENK